METACGCDVATMAFCPWTVERPARWKFLIQWLTLSLFCLTLGLRKRTYMAHSCGARQWAGIPAFPLPLPLINHRDDPQSGRLLSIRRAAGFPGVARAAARDLRSPWAKG